MGSFDSFKREAVQLERQLEDKVGRFQQMAQKAAVSGSDHLSRVEQGLDNSSDLAAYQQEIALLLQQLQDLISKKLEPAAVTPSQRAVSKRYREICHDLRSDYTKAVQVCQRHRERNELLGGASTAPNSANGRDAAMDSLLRERNHISNSMNAAASVIGQAEAVRQDLHWQGQSLRNTNSIMGVIANNIPGVNTLVDSIQRRRSKDDKIVAVVIATCIVFTLWYVLG